MNEVSCEPGVTTAKENAVALTMYKASTKGYFHLECFPLSLVSVYSKPLVFGACAGYRPVGASIR